VNPKVKVLNYVAGFDFNVCACWGLRVWNSSSPQMPLPLFSFGGRKKIRGEDAFVF